MSGLMHAQSILMMPSPINITFEDRTNGIMWFFLLQAAAITVEDFVQWSLRHMGLSFTNHSAIRTYFGYTWVVAFFWYSLPFAGDVCLRIRSGEQPMFKASPNAAWISQLLDTLD